MKTIIVILLLMLSSACSSVHYLMQAGRGQLEILNRAKPIQVVLQDKSTPVKKSNLLREIAQVKVFGENKGLKATSNYDEYVDLGRDAAVYVVTVSDALAFKPELFSFPIVGSFSYIGWFDRENADHFAKKYEQMGKDVWVRGAAAFSTLGWFKDPILSSMLPSSYLNLDETEYLNSRLSLIDLVFHESVHATVYFNNQSMLNESLADFLAEKLTLAYLSFYDQSALKYYFIREKNIQERMTVFAELYRELQSLYEGNLSLEQKAIIKAKLIKDFKVKNKYSGIVNNASLLQYQTYSSEDKGFDVLFSACGQDVKTFIATLKKELPSRLKTDQIENFKPILIELAERVRNQGMMLNAEKSSHR